MPLILIPYVSRTVGIERFGITEFSLELALFFGTVILYGFDFTMSKRLSQSRNDKNAYSTLFWNVFHTRLFLLVVSLPVLLTAGYLYADSLFNSEVVLYVALFVVSRLFSSWWFLQGLEEIKWIAVGNLVSKAIVLLFVLGWVKNPDDYPYVVLSYGLAQLLTNMSTWLLIIKKFRLRTITIQWSTIRTELSNSFYTFSNELLILSFSTVNILVIKDLLTPQELGVYAATIKVVIIVQNLVIQSLSKSLYPHLAFVFSQDQSKYKKLLNQFRNYLIAGLSVLALGIVLFRHQIVWLLFGDGYEQVSEMLIYVAMLPLFIGLTNIYGWQGLYLLDKQKKLTSYTLLVGIVSITSLILLTPEYGVKAPLLIRNGSEILVLLLCLAAFRKEWNRHARSA